MEGFTEINPFRSPGWRCERVMELIRQQRLPGRRDDHPIRTYRRFILHCNAAGDDESKLEALYAGKPHIAQMHFLHYSSALV